MSPAKPQARTGPKAPVFPLACALLGLVALAELLVAGLALATRLEDARQVRIVEKEVLKPVVLRVPAASPEATAGATTSRPPQPAATTATPVTTAPPAADPLPAPTPVQTPPIADARSERLVTDARACRVAGDMARAMIKLEEALGQSPDDPAVHYELGLIHEQMGVFDTASDHYNKVFQMGVSRAGSLYTMAAAKLRDGFAQPRDMLGKLALGRVGVFNNTKHPDGQQVILTIPVNKGTDDALDVSKMEVRVLFFNRNSKGDILQLEDNSWTKDQWTSLPIDWAGGEETLRITYTIPPQDEQTEHLFGDRVYYGQVVSLLYDGEVLDVDAWPRDLAARVPNQAGPQTDDMPPPGLEDALPPDFNQDIPLLPTRPE